MRPTPTASKISVEKFKTGTSIGTGEPNKANQPVPERPFRESVALIDWFAV
jgi:hypothetical protein